MREVKRLEQLEGAEKRRMVRVYKLTARVTILHSNLVLGVL